MTETFNIVNKFLADVCLKLRCQLIYRAGKHEILPYSQTQLITDIKKPVIRIKTAAPHADNIIICQFTVHEKLSGTFFASLAQKMFFRNIIRAHGKKCLAIDFMGKTFSPFILVSLHGHGAKTDSPFPGIHCLSITEQNCFHLIKRLRAKSIHPPKFWILNGKTSASFFGKHCLKSLSFW